jgi:hypothetical protein
LNLQLIVVEETMSGSVDSLSHGIGARQEKVDVVQELGALQERFVEVNKVS